MRVSGSAEKGLKKIVKHKIYYRGGGAGWGWVAMEGEDSE